MMKLFKRNRSISMKRYALMKNEEKEFIDYVLQNSIKSNPMLRIGRKNIKPKSLNFWNLSGNDIVLLRHFIGNQNIKAILKLLYNITDADFLKLDVFNCSACYLWSVEQLKKINDVESEELGGKPTSEDKAAGVEKLSEFGYSVWLHQLSQSDITKEEDILKLKYSRIFKKRCLMKTLSDIQKQKEENASRKAKRNRR